MQSVTNEAWSRSSTLLGPARVGEIVATTIVACLVAGFYAAHLFWATGFFTSAFTPLLGAFFFASIAWTVFTAGFKAATRRKDLRALVEWIGSVLFAGVTAWLYAVFPFNFNHLADIVPVQLQFLLNWMTNEIGMVLVALILVVAVIALAVNTLRLVWRVSVRELSRTVVPRN